MQRCPKCGYSERVDWPGILGIVAFFLLYFVWMIGDYRPRDLRGLGLAALILFLAASTWKVLKLKASRRLKSGPIAKAPSQ
jgi:hypothetical protein